MPLFILVLKYYDIYKYNSITDGEQVDNKIVIKYVCIYLT